MFRQKHASRARLSGALASTFTITKGGWDGYHVSYLHGFSNLVLYLPGERGGANEEKWVESTGVPLETPKHPQKPPKTPHHI